MFCVNKVKIEMMYSRLTSLVTMASMMIEYSTSQVDESDLNVLSRKVRYALFPDASTMGVCIQQCLFYSRKEIRPFH
jgi:hypothetical protein